jgi:hypothetical protein
MNSSSCFSFANATMTAPKINRIPIIVPVRLTLSKPKIIDEPPHGAKLPE